MSKSVKVLLIAVSAIAFVSAATQPFNDNIFAQGVVKLLSK